MSVELCHLCLLFVPYRMQRSVETTCGSRKCLELNYYFFDKDKISYKFRPHVRTPLCYMHF